MATCTICRFETELDEVVISHSGGQCICLRCFARETRNDRSMPRALRRELLAVLHSVEAL